MHRGIVYMFFSSSLLPVDFPFTTCAHDDSTTIPLLTAARHFSFEMAFRGTESPMDFEWQGHGPVDPASPFHKHIMDAQAKKRMFEQPSPRQGAYTEQ